MDLTLFHQPSPDGSSRDYRMKDKLNGYTALLPCRFLEWSGWYNGDIAQRLLGHYRLFQHYKTHYARQQRDIAAVQAYILQYRAKHGIKYFISRFMAIIYSVGTWKEYYSAVEVAAINRMLVNGSSGILQEFLAGADTDFAAALKQALGRINEPSFFDKALDRPINLSLAQSYQSHSEYTHIEHNNYNTDNRQFNTQLNNETIHNHEINNEFNTYPTFNDHSKSVIFSRINMQPVIKEGAKGKEKGVFSKKQVLIFLDLLSETSTLDKIDCGKPTKYDDYAALLHAFTGKTAASWTEELNNYRNRGLYEYHTPGELAQLISTISNLTEYLRPAGFWNIVKVAERKLKELESKKKKE